MRERLKLSPPNIPSFESIKDDLAAIWESGYLTNHGPIERRFERKLEKVSNCKYAFTCVNGTFAISLALESLGLTDGEVITTPFSWISSSSALINHGLSPAFVDIDPETLNINAGNIEDAITENTVAILAVHTFGNPCDVLALEKIGAKYNLPIIYDAAHAMGTLFEDKSILTYGSISTTSFHATKIVSCGEGGALFTNCPQYATRIKELRSYGFDENKNLNEVSGNFKFNEIGALVATKSLDLLEKSIENRRQIHRLYKERLDPNKVAFQRLTKGCNFSYFPIIFKSELELLTVRKQLDHIGVASRRYFYPSLDTYQKVSSKSKIIMTENALSISQRILILPCHNDVHIKDIEQICNVVNA